MPINEPVLAIVVNWNGNGVLQETVDLLEKGDYPALTILVVDNASSDGSANTLSDNILILHLRENRGYAAALNAGIKWAESTKEAADQPAYYLLLNNDLSVATDTVSGLVQEARLLGPGVYGPAVIRSESPGTLEAAWGKVTWSHVLARYYGKSAQVSEQWDRDDQVELLLGSILLIHNSVFKEVGYFDESFFMYHEEVDFLYRCKLADVPVYFRNKFQVLHRGAHSTRGFPLKKTYWLRRNTLFFMRKHQASIHHWLYWGSTLAMSLAFNFFTLRWQRTAAILKGVVDGLRQQGRFTRRADGK